MVPLPIAREFDSRLERILQEDETGCNAVIRLAELESEWNRSPFNTSPRDIRESILAGAPVLVKDNIDTQGLGTTAGSLALSGVRVDSDAPIIKNLRASGGLVLGKTNLSEWANFRSSRSLSGWSSKGRQTLNAFDPARSPSGSSSGSAVAIARGYAEYALGTETDGSIISPAAHAGIVGIKPSKGLLDCTGIIPIASSQDTPGPMAATMGGAARLLAALLPPDPAAQAIVERLITPQAANPAGLRFGVWTGGEVFLQKPYAPILLLLEELAVSLVQAGAVRVPDELCDPEDRISLREAGELEMAILLHEFRDEITEYLTTRRSTSPIQSLEGLIGYNEIHREQVMPYFGQDLFEQALGTPGKRSHAYRQSRDRLNHIMLQDCLVPLFESNNLDLLLMPSNGPAWIRRPGKPQGYSGGTSSLAAISGWPSATLPLDRRRTPEHLPIGVSLLVRPGQDEQLCRIGLTLEQLIHQGNQEHPNP
ncbi:amidase family protein [Spirochaeta lutea]|uniref:amidase family protein n=1 Tax=Spirochaeta lutea TaxID=1480694 RepID=UPI00069144D6|nr:amidase family protein [Spirochaeta lutea]